MLVYTYSHNVFTYQSLIQNKEMSAAGEGFIFILILFGVQGFSGLTPNSLDGIIEDVEKYKRIAKLFKHRTKVSDRHGTIKTPKQNVVI
jgi:hypothetical protein